MESISSKRVPTDRAGHSREEGHHNFSDSRRGEKGESGWSRDQKTAEQSEMEKRRGKTVNPTRGRLREVGGLVRKDLSKLKNKREEGEQAA